MGSMRGAWAAISAAVGDIRDRELTRGVVASRYNQPDRPVCVRVTAMRHPAWLRRPGRPASPPESSCSPSFAGSLDFLPSGGSVAAWLLLPVLLAGLGRRFECHQRSKAIVALGVVWGVMGAFAAVGGIGAVHASPFLSDERIAVYKDTTYKVRWRELFADTKRERKLYRKVYKALNCCFPL